MSNYKLIKGMGITLRVRLGKTTMLMQELNTLDNGSIIESEQLSNQPVDILYQNRVVAVGEVVIVDGNFGVQITKMKDRLDG